MTKHPWAAANLQKINETRKPVHITHNCVVGKTCRKCGQWNALKNYPCSAVTSDGLENRCKACNAMRSLRYYHKNKDSIKRKTQLPERREKRRKSRSSWNKARRRTNIQYRLSRLLRSRLYRALHGLRKEAKTLELLGCSLDALKQHLEQKFTTGMSWTNCGRGGWEIDHRIPLAVFNLSNEVELRRACHYTNLQPLWGPENWRKRDKVCM